MRTSAIIKIVTNLILAIVLILILVNFLGGNQFGFKGFKMFSFNLGGFNYSFDDASKYSIADGKISVDDIRELDIDWVAGKVKIEEYSGDKIEFYEENSSELSEDNKMRYLIDNGKLKIKFRKSFVGIGFVSFKPLNKELVIRIPVSMEDGLAELKLDNVSSSIEIDALIANTVLIDSVSGEINIKNLIAKKLDVETVSGAVNVFTESEFVDAETISGRLNISISSKSIEKVDIESVSGGVSLDLGNSPKILDVETISGKVDITLPENDGFVAKYDSVSGKFKCDFEVSISKNEAVYKDAKINTSKLGINTVSGNININKK